MTVTFGDLRDRIQREANRPSAAYADDIENAIITAIKFWEWQPIYFTETNTTLTLLSGGSTVALPSGFKKINTLQLLYNGLYYGQRDGFSKTTAGDLLDTWKDSTYTARPSQYALYNGNIIFNCVADQQYTLRIYYTYGDTTYPSADADVSVWFGDAADLIRYEALSTFYLDRLHDSEQAAVYKAKADAYYNNLCSRNNMRESEYILDA